MGENNHGKLCIIYNSAALYREEIFKLIDKTFSSVWYFGDHLDDIKQMDTTQLKEVHIIENKKIYGPLYYQKGVLELLGKKEYSTFLILGESICFSTWLILLKHKFVHCNKKIYLWSHGWYGKESWLRKLSKKWFYSMADGIFLYGNYARKQMISEGFDEKKLFTIHNSLHYDEQLYLRQQVQTSDVYKTHFGNDNPVLIFIGRLTTVKRLDMLLEALYLLKTEGQKYNVVFVGDGVKKSELQKQTKIMALDEQVWFYGACYDEITNAELIYNADLCVAPGNVGLTAMHTMVFGCPVLTHDNFAWQMPEFEAIKEEKTGTFFKQDDVNDLAAKISAWFNNHDNERDAIRKACFSEIDAEWTPYFQIDVLKKHLQVTSC